jgi:hypothetical protein
MATVDHFLFEANEEIKKILLICAIFPVICRFKRHYTAIARASFKLRKYSDKILPSVVFIVRRSKNDMDVFISHKAKQ